MLTIAELVRRAWPHRAGVPLDAVGLAAVVVISLTAFQRVLTLPGTSGFNYPRMSS